MTMVACADKPVDTTITETSQLETIVVPTMPDTVPKYLEIDPDTGLHMTGKPTLVDFANYRLTVTGLVENELSLTFDDVRRLPRMTATPRLECQGYFVDYATWTGGSLIALLEMAGLKSEATNVRLVSADGYKTLLTLKEAMDPENFLAYELNGETLPVLQGFPLRAVIPAMYGYAWAKWLIGIEVV